MKRLSALFLVFILLALPGLAAQMNEEYTPEELLQLWYQAGAMLRENGLYPYVELRKGDRGYEVLALQERLKALDYYDKEIVPVFGGGTEGALRRFERVNKLRVNGWASAEDQVLLFKSTALASSGLPAGPQASTGIFDMIPSAFGTATLVPQMTDLPTAAPVTVKPPTPKPGTTSPAPVTAAPVTPAPVTPAPVTAAPVTPAPVTPAPVTPAPVTPAPITDAPVTDAPATINPDILKIIPDNIGSGIFDKIGTPTPLVSYPKPTVLLIEPILDFSMPGL